MSIGMGSSKNVQQPEDLNSYIRHTAEPVTKHAR